jgi:hypothetical protein
MINGQINVLAAISASEFWWVALHNAPTSTPDLTNELNYFGYKRTRSRRDKENWFVSGGKVENATHIFFPHIHREQFVPCTHVGIWSQETGGNLIVWVTFGDAAVFRLLDRPVIEKRQMCVYAHASSAPA